MVETFSGVSSRSITSRIKLTLNTWQHIALTLKGTVGTLYINGEVAVSGTLFAANTVNRALNYIGKGNKAGSTNAVAQIDDLRIYNSALSQSDIMIMIGYDSYYSINSKLTNYLPFESHTYDLVSIMDLRTSSGTIGYTNDRNLNKLSALSLNSAFFSIPSGIYFGAGDFTIMLWINMVSFDTKGSGVFDFGLSTQNDNVMLIIQSTGRPLLRISNNARRTDISANTALTIGKWQHLAIVLKSTTATIYLDGNVIASATSVVPRSIIRNSNFLGKNNLASIASIKASLDDLRLYSTALSAYQIFVSISYDKYYSFASSYTYNWRFDNNLNNVVSTSPLTIGSSASFTADRFLTPTFASSLSNGYLRAPSQIYFSGGDFTIMVWLQLASFTGSSSLLCFTETTNPLNNYVAVLLSRNSNGKPFVEIANSGNKLDYSESSQNLLLNTWQHLAITFVASTGLTKMYMNGLQVSEDRLSTPRSVTRNNNFIGRCSQIYPGFSTSNIQIDDLLIFTKALTQPEIINKIAYDNGYNLVTSIRNYWKFDSNKYDFITKQTSPSSSSDSFTTDRFGNKENALLLSSGYIQIPNGIYFDSDFSISFWIKLTDLIFQYCILDIGNIDRKDNIGLYVEITDNLMFNVNNNGNSKRMQSNTKFIQNSWTHVVVTLALGKGSIYINGELDNQADLITIRSVIRSSNYIGFGTLDRNVYDNLNGALDDLRFYSFSLSPFQVRGLYNNLYF